MNIIFNNIFIFSYITRYTVIYSVLLFFNSNLFSKNLISGYYFSEPTTKKIQDDDFMNPGFLWVERGKNIWSKKIIEKESISCQGCHGDIKSMKGVSLKYPKVYEDTKKLINLEQQINICRNKNMNLKESIKKELRLITEQWGSSHYYRGYGSPNGAPNCQKSGIQV